MWLSENIYRVGKRLSGGHSDHNLPIEGLDGSVLWEQLLPGGISVAQDASVERVARLVLASFPEENIFINTKFRTRRKKYLCCSVRPETVETIEDN